MRSPAEIRRLCLRKYPEFLRSVVQGSSIFPVVIQFGKPSTATAFEQLRKEIDALTASDLRCKIEWREVRSPRLGLGRQKLPERIFFDNERDFLLTIGRMREAERFRDQLDLGRAHCPRIVDWIARRPLKVIEHADVWRELLLVCTYFVEHPRPGCYARELPLPIGTKFIGERQGILQEMLEVVLPASAIDLNADRFEDRFGLRSEEPAIRVRILDSAVAPDLWPAVLDDITVPRSVLARLEWPAGRILIVENRLTFVTLPFLTRTIAVWGAGDAVDLLKTAEWLRKSEIWYWGDLDIAGFRILDRLRGHFAQVRSVFMDMETLKQYRTLAVVHSSMTYSVLDHLTDEERATYAELNRVNLRLEQEKLPYQWTSERLRSLLSGEPPKDHQNESLRQR